jgi:hypothetical protein
VIYCPEKKYRGRTLVDFPTNSGFQWQFLIWQDLKGKAKEPKYIQNMCLKRSIFRRRRIGTHTYIYIYHSIVLPQKMTFCVYYIYIYVYNVYNISIYIYVHANIPLLKNKKMCDPKKCGCVWNRGAAQKWVASWAIKNPHTSSHEILVGYSNPQ